MGLVKKILQKILPNPLDLIIHRANKKRQKTFLLAWNRGLGDIALGLYPIIYRIREKIPDAKITFLIRKDLKDGFDLLENINYLLAPNWQRGKTYNVLKTLKSLNQNPSSFDVIIPWPDPTYWVRSLRGKLTPRLKWKNCWDDLYKKFELPPDFIYFAIQPFTETTYASWRNFPKKKWEELFALTLQNPKIKFLVFGKETKEKFLSSNLIDLRGKTSLFELLSIIKNVAKGAILPDSGILSMIYFLDLAFPFELLSLWEETDHGILKQNVSSPNPLLKHTIFPKISNLSPLELSNTLFSLTNESICKK